MKDNKIWITLRGKKDNKFYPNELKLKELTSILNNLDKLFVNLILQKYPVIKKNEIKISLSQITKGSTSLAIESNKDYQLYEAGIEYIKNVNKQNLDDYNTPTQTATQSLQKWVKDKDCDLEMAGKGMNGKKATLDPDKKYIKERLTMKGDTVLYGKLVELGGIEKIKGRILTIQGKTVDLIVPYKKADKYKDFLFRDVQAKGLATWEITKNGYILKQFEVEKISKIENKPLKKVNKEIKAKFRDKFKKMGNIEEYVKNIRGRGNEE